MQIRDYIIRRLLILPLLIIGVSIVVFALTRIGGSPIGVYLSHEMNASEVAALEARSAIAALCRHGFEIFWRDRRLAMRLVREAVGSGVFTCSRGSNMLNPPPWSSLARRRRRRRRS